MATLPYGDRRRRDFGEDGAQAPEYRRTGPGQIFIWAAWAVAAIFWGASTTTALGILQASPTTGVSGDVDAGGAGWLLMNTIGAFVLGLALAYGLYRYSTRNRRLDATTEASTARLYNSVEKSGGDDVVARSPEAERGSTQAT